MQSVSLSYARYKYFEENNKIINLSNCILLFYNEKHFSKQFGVSKKELLEKYKYSEYKESRENERNLQLKLV